MVTSALTALVLNCTLKPSPADSSGDLLGQQLLDRLAEKGVTGETVRVVDHHVRPGVEADMGDGDDWPAIRDQILAADILVFVSPTWMGHASSVAQLVLERLNADGATEGDDGNPILYGKVAVVGVVGNEDGAHKITADVYQALNDLGYTIPAQGGAYWNGEAMHKVDYNELEETPEPVAAAMQAAAHNAVHVASVLRGAAYPG